MTRRIRRPSSSSSSYSYRTVLSICQEEEEEEESAGLLSACRWPDMSETAVRRLQLVDRLTDRTSGTHTRLLFVVGIVDNEIKQINNGTRTIAAAAAGRQASKFIYRFGQLLVDSAAGAAATSQAKIYMSMTI